MIALCVNIIRFELHKGNKENFGKSNAMINLVFREGNIKRKAGEKEPTVSREEKERLRVCLSWHMIKRFNKSFSGTRKFKLQVRSSCELGFKQSAYSHS